MQFRLDLCKGCADKLRAILKDKGEVAMGNALGRVLCFRCLSSIPGYAPGQQLVTTFKARPS